MSEQNPQGRPHEAQINPGYGPSLPPPQGAAGGGQPGGDAGAYAGGYAGGGAGPAGPGAGAYGPPPYVEPRRQRGRKSPTLAAFLSCLPGLGHVYVGYTRRGFIHAAIFATIITLLASGDMHGLEPFLGISLAFFWFYNLVDAARRASALNRAVETGIPTPESDLPDLPGELSGRVGGTILIGLGFLLLLHTRFGLDMYWLRDWWPLVLILLGANIVRRNYSAS